MASIPLKFGSFDKFGSMTAVPKPTPDWLAFQKAAQNLGCTNVQTDTQQDVAQNKVNIRIRALFNGQVLGATMDIAYEVLDDANADLYKHVYSQLIEELARWIEDHANDEQQDYNGGWAVVDS